MSLEQDFPESIFSRFFRCCSRNIRAMLEQIPLQEILLLEEILG
jgi:hypothetical protein